VTSKEIIDNMDCSKIVFSGTGIIEGSGKQAGMDVTMDGKNTINGAVYVAQKKGILVSGEQTVENDMTVTITGAQVGVQTMLTDLTIKTKLLQ
jgi:hypothetical protein